MEGLKSLILLIVASKNLQEANCSSLITFWDGTYDFELDFKLWDRACSLNPAKGKMNRN